MIDRKGIAGIYRMLNIVMMNTQLPRKHHYVPEFLLKRWVGLDGKFLRYTAPYKSIMVSKRCFPSETGFQKDLYTMNLRKEINRQYLEKNFFSVLDNEAANFLNDLSFRKGDYVKIKPDRRWARFILNMLHRSPYYFAKYRLVAEKIMLNQRESLRDRWEEKAGIGRMSEFENYFNNRSYEDMVETLIEISPQVFTNSNIVDYMMEMIWCILPKNQNCFNVLISDEYIVRTNGVKKPDGHIAMAISPNAILVLANTHDFAEDIINMNRAELFRNFNKYVVSGARNFVADVDDRQDKFIRRHFSTDLRSALVEESD